MSRFGTKTFRETLAREGGEFAESLNAPEGQEVGIEGGSECAGLLFSFRFASLFMTLRGGSWWRQEGAGIQNGERKMGDGLQMEGLT